MYFNEAYTISNRRLDLSKLRDSTRSFSDTTKIQSIDNLFSEGDKTYLVFSREYDSPQLDYSLNLKKYLVINMDTSEAVVFDVGVKNHILDQKGILVGRHIRKYQNAFFFSAKPAFWEKDGIEDQFKVIIADQK